MKKLEFFGSDRGLRRAYFADLPKPWMNKRLAMGAIFSISVGGFVLSAGAATAQSWGCFRQPCLFDIPFGTTFELTQDEVNRDNTRVFGTLSLRDSTLTNRTSIRVFDFGRIFISPDGTLLNEGTLLNGEGPDGVASRLGISLGGKLKNTGILSNTGRFDIHGTFENGDASSPSDSAEFTTTHIFFNNSTGTFLNDADATANISGLFRQSGAIKNSGSMNIEEITSLDGNSIENSAGAMLDIESGDIKLVKIDGTNPESGALLNTGTVETGGKIILGDAGRLVNAGSGIIKTSGLTSTKTNADIRNSNRIDVGGDAVVSSAGSLTNSGTLDVGFNDFKTSGNMNNSGTVKLASTENEIVFSTDSRRPPGLFENTGYLENSGDIQLQRHMFRNSGTVVNSGNIFSEIFGRIVQPVIRNSGHFENTADGTVKAHYFTSIYSDTNVLSDTAGTVSNSGRIEAGAAEFADITNTFEGLIETGALSATGQFENSGEVNVFQKFANAGEFVNFGEARLQNEFANVSNSISPSRLESILSFDQANFKNYGFVELSETYTPGDEPAPFDPSVEYSESQLALGPRMTHENAGTLINEGLFSLKGDVRLRNTGDFTTQKGTTGNREAIVSNNGYILNLGSSSFNIEDESSLVGAGSFESRDSTLVVNGTMEQASIALRSTNLEGSGILRSLVEFQGASSIVGDGLRLSRGATNSGQLTSNGNVEISGDLTGAGTFRHESGTLTLDGMLDQAAVAFAGGSIAGTGSVKNASKFENSVRIDTGSVLTLNAEAENTDLLSIRGRLISKETFENKGRLTVLNSFTNDGQFTNSGLLQFAPGMMMNGLGSFVQTQGGSLFVDGTIRQAEGVKILGGSVSGIGNIQADTQISNAFVSAGYSPGRLSFGGDLDLFAGTSLLFELGGFEAGLSYDQFDIFGTATIASGTMFDINYFDGFETIDGGVFDLIVAGDIVTDLASLSFDFNDVLGADWGLSIFDFGNGREALRLSSTINVGPDMSAVPLPGSIFLFATGIFGLFSVGRRKFNAAA